jgi:hypothetical protein
MINECTARVGFPYAVFPRWRLHEGRGTRAVYQPGSSPYCLYDPDSLQDTKL